jgi:hypothetical protein
MVPIPYPRAPTHSDPEGTAFVRVRPAGDGEAGGASDFARAAVAQGAMAGNEGGNGSGGGLGTVVVLAVGGVAAFMAFAVWASRQPG